LAKATGLSKSGLFAHFNSKEQMQVDLLKSAGKKFNDVVIKPSLKIAKGELRIRSIAENLIQWDNADFMPGGCLFMTAIIEFDDRPGVVKVQLEKRQKLWFNYLSKVVNYAVEVGQFRQDLDLAQFVFEFQSIFPTYHNSSRLLKDPQAENRAYIMLDRLIENART
jgi:AcrR family transcriptional regulator